MKKLSNIGEVCTDNYEDYYSLAIFEYHPENLPINKK